MTSALAHRQPQAAADQAIFETVYRGRQHSVYHMSYLRLSKVFALLDLLQGAGVSLERRSILDYSFGAGTFFRYCPRSARLHGVEIDPVTVMDVKEMLRRREYPHVDLRVLDVERWSSSALLGESYDLIVCSHVLEHLEDPLALLQRLQLCTKPSGLLAGLVPINERYPSPHHVWRVTAERISRWAEASGFAVVVMTPSDPWSYHFQGLLTYDDGLRHRLAQMTNLLIGLAATALARRRWRAVSAVYARMSRAKPAQLGFLLRPR